MHSGAARISLTYEELNSPGFRNGAAVLMADGRVRALELVRRGDHVLAFDLHAKTARSIQISSRFCFRL